MYPLLDKDILKAYLEPLRSVQKPSSISLEEFLKKSEDFSLKFPKDTARVKTLLKKWEKETLEQKVNSAYPVVHERALHLAAEFLHYKKQNGTSIERKLYAEMDLVSFFNRLLNKRPYVFYCANDRYLLRNKESGSGGFEKIGTHSEDPELSLKEYLSYDEMKISALISISSLSCFINNGNRFNKGIEEETGEFVKEGVIIGAVGARLKKKSLMEWQDCIITREQNSESLGYGRLRASSLPAMWARMWGSTLPLWEEVDPKQTDYLNCGGKRYFNSTVYRRRIQLTAEVILREAAWRAHSQGRKAYIHVVGLGLGVWRAIDEQEEIFVDAWGVALGQVDTTHISDVDFSWIKVEVCKGVREGEKLHGVTLHFTTRSLHDPVPEGMLLVCTYAWDGNSLPGNEYWLEKLCSTGDGAAACSSQVAEIHNTFINPNVCGANLHITSKQGVEHIGQYAQRMTDVEDETQRVLGETSEVPVLIDEGEWPRIGEQGTSGTRMEKESSQKTGELNEKDEIDSGQHQSSKDGEQVEVNHTQRGKKNFSRKGQRGESYHRRGSDSPRNRSSTGEVLVKIGGKHKLQKSHGEDKRDQGSHLNSGNRYKQQDNVTDIGSGVNGFADREYSGRYVQEKPRGGIRRPFEGGQWFARTQSRSNSRTNRRNSSKDGSHGRNPSKKSWNDEYKEDYNQDSWITHQGTSKTNITKEEFQKPSAQRHDEQIGQRQKGISGWDSGGVEEETNNWNEDSVPTQNVQSLQLTDKQNRQSTRQDRYSTRQDRHSARQDRHSTLRQDRHSASRQDRHSDARQGRHSGSRQDRHPSSRNNGYSEGQNSYSKYKQTEQYTHERGMKLAEIHTQSSYGQDVRSAFRQSTQREFTEKQSANSEHIQSAQLRPQQKSLRNSQTETCFSQTQDAKAHSTQHPQIEDGQPSQGEDARPSRAQDAHPSPEQDVCPLVCDTQSPQMQVVHPSPVEDKQVSHVQEVKQSHAQDVQASQVNCAGPVRTHSTLPAGTQASHLSKTQDTQPSCIDISGSVAHTGPQVQSLTNALGQAFDPTESSADVDRNMRSQSKELESSKTDQSLPSSEKAKQPVESEYLWCNAEVETTSEVVEISEQRMEHQGKSYSHKGHSGKNPKDFEYSGDMYSPQHHYHSRLESPHISGPYSQNAKGYGENGGYWQYGGRRGRGQRPGRGDNYYSQTSMESGKTRHRNSGRGRDYCQQPHQHSRGKDSKYAWSLEKDLKTYSDANWPPRLMGPSSAALQRSLNVERTGSYRGKSHRGHRNGDHICRVFTSSHNASYQRNGCSRYMNGFDDFKGNYNNYDSRGRRSSNFECRSDLNYSDDVRKHPFTIRRNQLNFSDERKKSTACNLHREKMPSNIVDTRKEDCTSGISGRADTAISKDVWKDSTREEQDNEEKWKDSLRSKQVISAADTSNTDHVSEQNVVLVSPNKAEESCLITGDHSTRESREQADLSGQSLIEEHISREESGQEAKDYNVDGELPREPKFVGGRAEQQHYREKVASADDSRVWGLEFEPEKGSWHQENFAEKSQAVPPQNVELRQLTQSPAVAFQEPQTLLQLSQPVSQLSQSVPQLSQTISPFSQAMAQPPSQPVPPSQAVQQLSQSIPQAVSQLSPAVAPLSQALPPQLSQALPHFSQTISHFTQAMMPPFTQPILQAFPPAIPTHFSPSVQPLTAQALPQHHIQGRTSLNASRQSFSQQHTQASQQQSQPRLLHHQQGQSVPKHILMPWLLQQQQQQQQQPPPPLNYEQHDSYPSPSEHTSYSSSPHCMPVDEFGGKLPRVDVSRQNMMSYTAESPLSNSQSQSSHVNESFWTPSFPSNSLVLQPTLSPGISQVQQVAEMNAIPNLVPGMTLMS